MSCWERQDARDLRLIRANDRFLSLIAIEGSPPAAAPPIDAVPPLPPHGVVLLHRALDSGEPVTLDGCAVQMPGGGIRRLDITLTPAEGTAHPTVVMTMRDVTRMHQLEAMNRIKDEFVANASHELRTPLTAVLGSLATIARGADLPDEVRRELLDAAERQARRLGELLENLLAASRLAGAEPAVATEEVDVRSFVHEIAGTLRSRAPHRTIRVRVTGTPVVTSDPTLLYRVLYNLGDNALKYSDGPVALGARVARGAVRIDVADRGIGIGDQDLTRIFERFQQLGGSGARRVGGVGLGLYLSSRLASVLGGRIDVRSEPGVGSTFTLILPVQPQMSLLDLSGDDELQEVATST